MNKAEILTVLKKKELQTLEPFIGCTDDEIKQLENDIGCELPFTYREFLRAVGHASGKLFQGTEVHYSKLKEIQKYAKDLLEENNNPIILPETAFIFSLHQGYEIKYFELNGDQNPSPIYEWYEGSNKKNMISTSFEEFLLGEIEKHAKINWGIL